MNAGEVSAIDDRVADLGAVSGTKLITPSGIPASFKRRIM
jgi:hypothetical protein